MMLERRGFRTTRTPCCRGTGIGARLGWCRCLRRRVRSWRRGWYGLLGVRGRSSLLGGLRLGPDRFVGPDEAVVGVRRVLPFLPPSTSTRCVLRSTRARATAKIAKVVSQVEVSGIRFVDCLPEWCSASRLPPSQAWHRLLPRRCPPLPRREQAGCWRDRIIGLAREALPLLTNKSRHRWKLRPETVAAYRLSARVSHFFFHQLPLEDGERSPGFVSGAFPSRRVEGGRGFEPEN